MNAFEKIQTLTLQIAYLSPELSNYLKTSKTEIEKLILFEMNLVSAKRILRLNPNIQKLILYDCDYSHLILKRISNLKITNCKKHSTSTCYLKLPEELKLLTIDMQNIFEVVDYPKNLDKINLYSYHNNKYINKLKLNNIRRLIPIHIRVFWRFYSYPYQKKRELDNEYKEIPNLVTRLLDGFTETCQKLMNQR